jgi:hypothetical protein
MKQGSPKLFSEDLHTLVPDSTSGLSHGRSDGRYMPYTSVTASGTGLSRPRVSTRLSTLRPCSSGWVMRYLWAAQVSWGSSKG